MSSPSLTVDTPATEMSAGRKLAAWQREKMSGARHVAFIMMKIFTYNLDLDNVVSTHCYFRRRIIRFGENTAVVSTGLEADSVHDEGGIVLILLLPHFTESEAVLTQIHINHGHFLDAKGAAGHIKVTVLAYIFL